MLSNKTRRTGSESDLPCPTRDRDFSHSLWNCAVMRGHEIVIRIATTSEFIQGVANLPCASSSISVRRPTTNSLWSSSLDICGRVIGMAVNSVSNVITLTPDQAKPAREIGAALNTGY